MSETDDTRALSAQESLIRTYRDVLEWWSGWDETSTRATTPQPSLPGRGPSVCSTNTQANGPPTGARDFHSVAVANPQLATAWIPDWKRRQLIPETRPRYVEPSIAQRIARLSPQERHELKTLVTSLKLRKAVRAVLRAAYHRPRETQEPASTPPS